MRTDRVCVIVALVALTASEVLAHGADRAVRLRGNADRAANIVDAARARERVRRLEQLRAADQLQRARRAERRLLRRLKGPETPTYSQHLTRQKAARDAARLQRLKRSPRASSGLLRSRPLGGGPH